MRARPKRPMHCSAEKNAPLPDALFGINDIMAMGAIDTLRHRLGLRVPEDLMVAGFDDIPGGGAACPIS